MRYWFLFLCFRQGRERRGAGSSVSTRLHRQGGGVQLGTRHSVHPVLQVSLCRTSVSGVFETRLARPSHEVVMGQVSQVDLTQWVTDVTPETSHQNSTNVLFVCLLYNTEATQTLWTHHARAQQLNVYISSLPVLSMTHVMTPVIPRPMEWWRQQRHGALSERGQSEPRHDGEPLTSAIYWTKRWSECTFVNL